MLDRLSVPFGGVAILLVGDFWQKPPPSSIPMAEMLVSMDAPISKQALVLDPSQNKAKAGKVFWMLRLEILMAKKHDKEFAWKLQGRDV